MNGVGRRAASAWSCALSLSLAMAASAAEAPREALSVSAPPTGSATGSKSSCSTTACHASVSKHPHLHTALKDSACTACHVEVSAAEPATVCSTGKHYRPIKDPDLCLSCHYPPDPKTRHAALERGCLSCHGGHGGSTNANLVKASVQKLCTDCHSNEQAAVVHSPVAEGSCTSCHNPHASPNKPLLRVERSALCFGCHERADFVADASAPISHYPVASGDCLVCHKPHSSDHPKLLQNEPLDLCQSCHTKRPDGETPGSRLRIDLGQPHRHPALEDSDCRGCHAPHRSANESLLREPMPSLCWGCHEAFAGPHQHSAVVLGRCGACHDPHASAHAKLLKEKEPLLCFICHSDDVRGRTSVHQPLKEGTCTSCHSPHVGTVRALLVRGPGNQTCLSCHGPAGSSRLRVDLGRRSVHTAVVRFGCNACHDPHGTDFQGLLTADVNTLCASCHEDHKDGAHIISGFGGKMHPVSGPKDPVRSGRKFSCVSCHEPHASDYYKLSREGADKMSTCGRCHKRFRAQPSQGGKEERPGRPITR